MINAPEPVLRYRGGDRHHLFLNHGTWFLRYSLRPSPLFKADRRDAFLAHLLLHRAQADQSPRVAIAA